MRFILIIALACASVRCDDATEPRDTVSFQRIEATDYDADLPEGGVAITVKLWGDPQGIADDCERAALALMKLAREARDIDRKKTETKK